MENLPQEIFESILNNVDSELDLRECQTVSPQWKATVNSILYKNITFREGCEGISKSIERMKTLQKTMETCGEKEGLHDIVKCVNIIIMLETLPEEHKLTILSFLQYLGNMCTKITTLKILDMTSRDLNDELAKKLWDTIQKGKWKLEEIGNTLDFGYIISNNKYYISTLLAFRETIKKIQLYVKNKPQENGESEAQEYILKSKLDSFPNLSNLTLSVVGFKEIYELDNYIPDGLKYFRLIPILTSCELNEPPQWVRDITGGDVSKIKQCTAIKKLKFSGLLNESTINYTIYKFPQLEDLTIDILYWYEDVQDPTIDMIKNFANYLVNIKNININRIIWRNSTELIRAIIEKNKANNIKAKWRVFLYGSEKQIVSLVKKKCANNVESYTATIGLQDTSIFLGNFGTHLIKVHIERPMGILITSSIFYHCPNLKHLKIISVNILLDTFTNKVTNKTFEKLTLKHCKISPGVFSKLSMCFPNLKSLKILGRVSCEFDLSSIITGFSSLEDLKVENSQISLDNLPSTGKNTFLRKLVFSYCKISPGIFPVLSKYFPNLKYIEILGNDQGVVDLSSVITGLSSLEYLKVEKFQVSLDNIPSAKKNTALRNLIFSNCKISLAIFPILSKHFPNLNFIECGGVFLNYEKVPLRLEGEKTIVGPIIIEMPHTYLKSLLITFDYDYSEHTEENPVHLPKTCSLEYYSTENDKVMTSALRTIPLSETCVNENGIIHININCKKFPIDPAYVLCGNKCMVLGGIKKF